MNARLGPVSFNNREHKTVGETERKTSEDETRNWSARALTTTYMDVSTTLNLKPLNHSHHKATSPDPPPLV